MKVIYALSGFSMIFNIFFAISLFKETNTSFKYQHGYDACMNHIESIQRNTGKINSNYTCKIKRN